MKLMIGNRNPQHRSNSKESIHVGDNQHDAVLESHGETSVLEAHGETDAEGFDATSITPRVSPVRSTVCSTAALKHTGVAFGEPCDFKAETFRGERQHGMANNDVWEILQ